MAARDSTEAEFVDGSAVDDAIKDVRSDATATDWMLARHHNLEPQQIELAGSGTGGVEELVANLDDGNILYGLVRVTEQIDMSTTVKFVYVYFSGEGVPFTKRGRMGVVHGNVRKHFQPYHCDFEITKKSELNAAGVQRKIAETSGRIDNVRAISEASLPTTQVRGFTGNSYTTITRAKASKYGFQGNSEQSKASTGLTFNDDVAEAIQDVRNDKTETNWCVCKYENDDLKRPVQFAAKGSDGLPGLQAMLTPTSIYYALLRKTDTIDGHQTVKFVFVIHIGIQVGIMQRAKLSTHKGGVVDKFTPFHVQIDTSAASELSETAVMNKIQAASGSRNWVR